MKDSSICVKQSWYSKRYLNFFSYENCRGEKNPKHSSRQNEELHKSDYAIQQFLRDTQLTCVCTITRVRISKQESILAVAQRNCAVRENEITLNFSDETTMYSILVNNHADVSAFYAYHLHLYLHMPGIQFSTS